MGGDIEVFFGGGGKVWEESAESRVQSPESRVQGPVLLLRYGYNLVATAPVHNTVLRLRYCYNQN